jgi:phosphomannomutase
MILSKVFREYDIRGVIGHEITLEGARQLGKAFATKVGRETGGRKIVVAYDGRLSSPELEQALVMGLMDAGAHVIRLGLGPTPLLYFASHYLKAAGAMMITGSHNPPDYNGFKMVISNQPVYGAQIQALRHLIEQDDFTNLPGGTQEHMELQDVYVQCLLDDFQANYPAFNLKVAWDPGNGATGNVLRRLLQELEGEHCLINGQIDGTFPAHHPDPTVEANLEDLKALTQIMQCDVGIAFDGDGDRIGVVDNAGQVVWADQLMRLYTDEVLQIHPGATIIADVKTSQHLFEYIHQKGGNPVMERTGHSLIKQKMKALKAPLAGEMSGHIFFADRYYGFDDALYAALRLLGILSQKQHSLANWAATLPVTHATPELKIPCDDRDKFAVVQHLKECLAEDQLAFNAIDGVRVTTNEGWWLLRASNTQEILVARAEAHSATGLEMTLNTIRAYLRRVGIEAMLIG